MHKRFRLATYLGNEGDVINAAHVLRVSKVVLYNHVPWGCWCGKFHATCKIREDGSNTSQLLSYQSVSASRLDPPIASGQHLFFPHCVMQ